MLAKMFLTFLIFLSASLMLQAQDVNQDASDGVLAQPQPFLYTINALNPAARQWSLNYSGGYGQNTVSSLGFDGVDQNVAVKGYLGNRFTLMASVGAGFANNRRIQSVQQAEVFKDFIGGETPIGFRLGSSLGIVHEFSNDVIMLSRFNAAYENLTWKFAANTRIEKAFAAGRDAFDMISSFGVQRHITGAFFGGIEAVGQDLEGLWETDEAEGGAKILIGPSLNYVPLNSRLVFSLCAGPILYASHSAIIPYDSAVRELPLNNGFTMKFNVGFRFL